jgi:hypothetical protein
MGAKILSLPSAADDVLIDLRVISELRGVVGDRVCRELLSDAVLDTAERLARLEAALVDRDMAVIGKVAHDLVSMTGQIGMTRLSAVSRDLDECVATSEWPTIRAVAGRLLRVGQETLATFPTTAP